MERGDGARYNQKIERFESFKSNETQSVSDYGTMRRVTGASNRLPANICYEDGTSSRKAGQISMIPVPISKTRQSPTGTTIDVGEDEFVMDFNDPQKHQKNFDDTTLKVGENDKSKFV